MDLSTYVRSGNNQVQVVVRTPPAGRLGAYIGAGDDSGATLSLSAPAVSWRSTGAPAEQDFTFIAP